MDAVNEQPDKGDEINDKEMPLMEHLVELRRRLMWSAVAIVIAFGVCYYCAPQIYDFLAAPLAHALQTLSIVELPRPRQGSRESVPAAQWQALLQPALQGHDLGLLSEAGLPAVADPGAALVRAAHAAGVPVLALPGPSSLLLALAASGLNGQSFAFVGYLPQDAGPRAARLKELEAWSRRTLQTQLIIETPYRNAALLQAMAETLAPATELSVSCGLTLAGGWSRTDRIAAWRERPAQMPDRWPAVFGLLAT